MYCIQVLQTIEGEQKHLFRRKSGGALNGGKFVTTPTSDSVRASNEPVLNQYFRITVKDWCPSKTAICIRAALQLGSALFLNRFT